MSAWQAWSQRLVQPTALKAYATPVVVLNRMSLSCERLRIRGRHRQCDRHGKTTVLAVAQYNIPAMSLNDRLGNGEVKPSAAGFSGPSRRRKGSKTLSRPCSGKPGYCRTMLCISSIDTMSRSRVSASSTISTWTRSAVSGERRSCPKAARSCVRAATKRVNRSCIRLKADVRSCTSLGPVGTSISTSSPRRGQSETDRERRVPLQGGPLKPRTDVQPLPFAILQGGNPSTLQAPSPLHYWVSTQPQRNWIACRYLLNLGWRLRVTARPP